MSSNNIEKNSTFIFGMIQLGFLQDDYFDEKGIVDYYRFKKTFLDSSQYFRILTTTAYNANCIYCYGNNTSIDFMNEKTASIGVFK